MEINDKKILTEEESLPETVETIEKEVQAQTADFSDMERLEDRVKILSPGRLVAKRFFRSKLSVIGLGVLIFLFLFSFLGPLFQFFPAVWGETEVDYTPGAYVAINKPFTFKDADGNDVTSYEYNLVRDETKTLTARLPAITGSALTLTVMTYSPVLCTAAGYLLRWDSSSLY